MLWNWTNYFSCILMSCSFQFCNLFIGDLGVSHFGPDPGRATTYGGATIVLLQFLVVCQNSTPLEILSRLPFQTALPPSGNRHWRPYYPIALAVAVFAAGCNRLLELLQMVGGRFGPRKKWILQSQGTTSETVGKNNGTIATTTVSNRCATDSNVMNNGRNGCELLIKNGCRTAEQWVEQRLSPTVQ